MTLWITISPKDAIILSPYLQRVVSNAMGQGKSANQIQQQIIANCKNDQEKIGDLEKVLIPTWPYVSEFPRLIKKYNKRINLTTFDEEEWTIIESLDRELRIADIISEFAFKTQFQALTDIESIQKRIY